MALRPIWIAIACALSLAACAPPYNTQPAVSRLSDNPWLAGGDFTSGGGITVAADVRESNGQTLVCGVWAESRQQSALTRRSANRVVSKGSIFMGNDRIVQNFLFMNKVDPAPGYAGAEAGCLLLDRPWQATDAITEPLIRIPQQKIVCEIDGVGGFCVYYLDRGRPGAGTG